MLFQKRLPLLQIRKKQRIPLKTYNFFLLYYEKLGISAYVEYIFLRIQKLSMIFFRIMSLFRFIV